LQITWAWNMSSITSKNALILHKKSILNSILRT
jgi:hypothetical protein